MIASPSHPTTVPSDCQSLSECSAPALQTKAHGLSKKSLIKVSQTTSSTRTHQPSPSDGPSEGNCSDASQTNLVVSRRNCSDASQTTASTRGSPPIDTQTKPREPLDANLIIKVAERSASARPPTQASPSPSRLPIVSPGGPNNLFHTVSPCRLTVASQPHPHGPSQSSPNPSSESSRSVEQAQRRCLAQSSPKGPHQRIAVRARPHPPPPRR